MKTHPSRTPRRTKRKAHHVSCFGRIKVAVYKRETPGGGSAFMVANYATGKRRFDCHATESDAIAAADRLARQLSKREVLAASLTNAQAAEYAAAVEKLAEVKAPLLSTATVAAECLKLLGTSATSTDLLAAVKFYTARNKTIIRKSVADVVAELITVKEGRRKSVRYLADLRTRLARFADAVRKDTCDVTTADVQAWLDALSLSPQSYKNYRTVAHLLFKFAVARGYAADNPVAASEGIDIDDRDVEIFTPAEIRRLLDAASPDFVPALALGAFAGLRSAEIERLAWTDIHLAERHIVIGAKKSKTASRRVVPIAENLAAWLLPYAERVGMVWPGTHEDFYRAQQTAAAATGVEGDAVRGIKPHKPVAWKSNALRHSYASYRFAQTGDAGRVAGELGNSAVVVHKHYRELVKPAEAAKWFAVMPPREAANVVPLPSAIS